MPSLVEIYQVILEEIFKILQFCYYLPLEKSVALHLNELEGCFVLSLVEISHVVLGKKMKC